MNTESREERNARVLLSLDQVIHKHEGRSISGNPALLTLGEARAKELGYESFSSYVFGLILYDCMMLRRHWFTPDLMDDPGLLQVALKEIGKKQPAEWPSYLEFLLKKPTNAQLRRLGFYGITLAPNAEFSDASKAIDEYKAAHPESEEAYQKWKASQQPSGGPISSAVSAFKSVMGFVSIGWSLACIARRLI